MYNGIQSLKNDVTFYLSACIMKDWGLKWYMLEITYFSPNSVILFANNSSDKKIDNLIILNQFNNINFARA